MRSRDPLVMATAGGLAAAAALHVAWGLRVQIPGVDGAAMAEAVSGKGEPPGPAACFAVAGLLSGAAASVAGARWLPAPLARLGRLGVVVGLGGRAALGITGHTDLVAPGEVTDRFRRWDRWLYTPLCLVLAAGAARSMRVHASR